MKNVLRAFTLIELLIVIVIIGILSTALIPRLTGMQDKARYTRVEKDFQDFKTAVFLAQTSTQKTLAQITINGHTSRYCSTTGDLRNLSTSSQCIIDWELSLRRIEVAAGMNSGSLATMSRDPWGSPYILDENEGERGSTDCRKDTFFSPGPDGLRGTDDMKFTFLVPTGCPGAY